MPALELTRQADALRGWLADPVGRRLLLEAQADWIERGVEASGGQSWLRLLPELHWPMPEPAARFSDAWTLEPGGESWAGAWRADLHALPVAGGTVSRIDLRFVLESVPAPERLLSECARVLRPEGRLLVFGLNPWGAARLRWARHGVRALPRARVTARLRAEGLDVLGERTLGPLWGPRGIDVAPSRARWDVGRVAWAVLAARRDQGLTPLRRAAQPWRGASGVPAA